MKTTKIVAALFLGVYVFCTGTAMFATDFKVGASGKKKVVFDNRVSKNQINFVSSAPLEDIKGTASDISGFIMLDPTNIESASGMLTVKVVSMETGVKKRDEHLKGPNWLNAEQYPAITFALKEIKDVQAVSNENGRSVVKGTAIGDFSLHGTTKQISIPVMITYIRESEKTKERAPGDFVFVQGKFSVALKDFKVEGTQGMIGSKVGEAIQLEANLFGSTGL